MIGDFRLVVVGVNDETLRESNKRILKENNSHSKLFQKFINDVNQIYIFSIFLLTNVNPKRIKEILTDSVDVNVDFRPVI